MTLTGAAVQGGEGQGGEGQGEGSVPGYFSGGGGPGVLVIHEWWGLTPHIVDVVERFAAAGFSALAPDLYHGRVATDEAEAAALSGALDHGRSLAELAVGIDHLIDVTGVHRVGVVGYSLGGGLALELAAARPDAVVAVAPYYGLAADDTETDWSRLEARVAGEFAENDPWYPPDASGALQESLRALGKDATINVHHGVGHGFFNDARPEAYAAEPALEAWERTLTLFRERLSDD